MNRQVSLFCDSRQATSCGIGCSETRRWFDNTLFDAAGQDDLLRKGYSQADFILWGTADRFISIASPTSGIIRSDLKASLYIRQNKHKIYLGMNPDLCSCLGIRLGKAADSGCFLASPKRFRLWLRTLPYYLHLSLQKPHNIQILSEFQRSINCEQSNLRKRSSFEQSLSSWKDRSHNVRKRLHRRRSRIYASFGQL